MSIEFKHTAATTEPVVQKLLTVHEISELLSSEECVNILSDCVHRYTLAADQVVDSQVVTVESDLKSTADMATIGAVLARLQPLFEHKYGEVAKKSRGKLSLAFVIALVNSDGPSLEEACNCPLTFLILRYCFNHVISLE